MPNLIIFDCDGVLVDSERISHLVLQQMLLELGVVISFEEAVERFIGSSTQGCFDKAATLLGPAMPPDFLAQFAQRCTQAFQAQLRPVAGVQDLLVALKQPYCVASNGNRAKVEFTLGHTGLRKLFGANIFTAEQVANPKPAPELFLFAAKRMGVAPESTVVVEDTPTGIRAARAAGMRAIGFASMTPAQKLLDAGAHCVAGNMIEVQALLGTNPC